MLKMLKGQKNRRVLDVLPEQLSKGSRGLVDAQR